MQGYALPMLMALFRAMQGRAWPKAMHQDQAKAWNKIFGLGPKYGIKILIGIIPDAWPKAMGKA